MRVEVTDAVLGDPVFEGPALGAERLLAVDGAEEVSGVDRVAFGSLQQTTERNQWIGLLVVVPTGCCSVHGW